MVAAFLLPTLLLALAVAAQPVEQTAPETSLVKLAFKKQVGNGSNIVKLDRRRTNSMKAGKAQALENRAGISSPAENRAVAYVASVGVGDPPTYYDLIVDSGSANIWIGAGKPYVKTNTSLRTSQSLDIKYGSGNITGTEYFDRVTIGPKLVVFTQSIGVANHSAGFENVDGVMGVGPVDLTNDTLIPDVNNTIPTVTGNLYAQGAIDKDMLSISFEPLTGSSDKELNGELTWGGIDSSKYIGDITYMPITATPPSNTFWGIDASITYGGCDILSIPSPSTPLLSTTAGIVDTGTTTFQLATDAFDKYKKLTGGVLDNTTTLLTITSAQYKDLKSLFVNVKDAAFELTPNAQIWPRKLNTAIGGTADKIYLIVVDIGAKSGSGMDFMLGQVFLERFYSVYDTANNQVGLAPTSFTHATTN